MFWLLWFAALLPLWLLTVGAFRTDILVAGVAAAALAATMAALMRRAGLLAFAIDLRVLAREARTTLRVYPDLVRIVAAVLRDGRSPRGGFRWVDYPYGTADGPRQRGSRAIVTTTSSLAPASYVVHIDGERGRMLLHEIGGGT